MGYRFWFVACPNIKFRLSCDQIVLFETAVNLWASRRIASPQTYFRLSLVPPAPERGKFLSPIFLRETLMSVFALGIMLVCKMTIIKHDCLVHECCAGKWIQNGAAMLWAGYAVRGDNVDRILCISRSFRRQSQSNSTDKRLYLYDYMLATWYAVSCDK